MTGPGRGPRVGRAPLSLGEALELAERESETVGIARADVARAEGERRRARSGYFPQLNGPRLLPAHAAESVLGARRTTPNSHPDRRPRSAPAFVPQPGFRWTSGSTRSSRRFRVRQHRRSLRRLQRPAVRPGEHLPLRPLLLADAVHRRAGSTGQTPAANAGVRSAEFGLTSARAQLLLDVTQAYYDAALGDRLVGDRARRRCEQADTTLSQTQLARQVGNQSEFDLLRARVTRDNQRPVVIQRRADRELAYYRLKQLLNLPLDQPLALTTDARRHRAGRPARSSPQLVETPGDTAPDVRAPVRQADEAVHVAARAAPGRREPSGCPRSR